MTASPTKLLADDDWVPAACTLPSIEQPLRRREFDDLFANDVRGVIRQTPTRAKFELPPEADVPSRAAALAVKETGCCSFFSFDLAIADGTVTLTIGTAPEHQDVLEALTARAERLFGSGPGASA